MFGRNDVTVDDGRPAARRGAGRALRRLRPSAVIVRWLAVFVLGLGAGIAATLSIAERSSDADASPVQATYLVRNGTLERVLRVPGTASWSVAGVVRSAASGIITHLDGAGYLEPGVALRINERPVVLLAGEVPAFRDLVVGTTGLDVQALQRYLAQLGFLDGDESTRFTARTSESVKRWQRGLGLPPTGSVRLGDVLFIPASAFSAPMRWAEGISVGVTLRLGDPLLETLAGGPELAIGFGASPPLQLQAGTRGEAIFGGTTRRSISLTAFHAGAGRTWAVLVPAEPMCDRSDCLTLVGPDGETAFDAVFTIVPRTTGPLVPVAAIQTDAGGAAFVTAPDGTRRSVSIRVVDGGFSIVDGILPGEQVRLP